MQEYLNNSDGHLRGIVSNGFLLRLLRDTSRTSRLSYKRAQIDGVDFLLELEPCSTHYEMYDR